MTRWLLAGSLAATAAVGGLAAENTHASSSSSVNSEVSSDDSSTLVPATSAPQQSFQTPVARSGGS